jgi:hypothetical protein
MRVSNRNLRLAIEEKSKAQRTREKRPAHGDVRERDQAAVRADAGRRIIERSVGLVRSTASLNRAVDVLEGLFAPAAKAKRVPLEARAKDQRTFRVLASGEMAGYSVEEIRRSLVADHPHLTRAYVEKAVRIEERPIDRFGSEPRFLVAAHLAHHFLGAEVGRTEDEAFASFLASNPSVAKVWPEFGPKDLPKLRRIYPFIPEWTGGIKMQADLSLARPYDNATSIREREKIDHLLRGLDELKKIPLHSPILDWVNELRDEEGALTGARYVDVSHALADKIPFLQSLIAYDGLRGKDIRFISKHYAAEPRVMDVMRRVFGAHVTEVPPRGTDLPIGEDADRVLEREAKEAILAAVEKEDGRPLLVHMGGVHIWHWLDALKRENPEVLIAGVSHTTSDGRDLIGEGGALSFPCELMSMALAKIEDERERFKHSLMMLLGKVEEELDRAIRARRFIVKGFGNIMGPAMAAALEAMGVDFAIHDIDPAARQRARDAGYEVIEDLRGEKDRSLVVLGCATGRAVTPEEIVQLEKPAIFLQVQTGRDAFPMSWVEAQSRDARRILERQFVTYIGHQPVFDYRIDRGKRKPKVAHTFIADGYVANLAFPRPNNTETSILTSLLIEESLRQSMWRLRRLAKGDEAQKGAHRLESLRISVTPDKPRRLISLFARSVEDVEMKPIAMRALESTSFRKRLRDEKDTPIMIETFGDVRGEKAPPLLGVRRRALAREIGRPRPGEYRDGLGRVMVEGRSTGGAWELAKPKTKTGRFAKEIVAHRFMEEESAFRAQWDGALDEKAMKELIALGIEERLIELDAKSAPTRIDRFLDELRPYQLDFVKNGADEIHRLILAACAKRRFFEISQREVGPVWSDGRANDLLAERLARKIPPPSR